MNSSTISASGEVETVMSSGESFYETLDSTGAQMCDSANNMNTHYKEGSITLAVDGFGVVEHPVTKQKEVVWRYTWSNANQMVVQAISYGATITAIKVPNQDGFVDDVVMGFDDVEGYLQPRNPHFGSTIGRVANRIGNATFCLNGQKIVLAKNKGEHHLHGGIICFDKFNWVPSVDGTKVTMTHVSDDGFEGYPGAVMAQVSFNLTEDNAIQISYMATVSRTTPINLTNHSYFNLGGHGSGKEELYKHIFTINSDKITVTDSDSIPTGEFQCVGGTLFDLRVPRQLGPLLEKLPAVGYDNNFCITKGTEQTMALVARVIHPESGRFLETYSDQPGVQFYTSNFLPDVKTSDITKLKETDVKPLFGKKGAAYTKHGSFCLETQKYPDAVNHSNFPSILVNPGEIYRHECIYKFGVVKTCGK